ncbi:hypothetical protein AVEN_72125-1 [Araneus ventricosus]|uniref:Uncharacterized protein n=1 Tax=Araneus ventricosus TaxID=182803 RepID=A0A4Y2NJA2_ARAVE|nr:hypothetical protein AVEN_72125-1 [Araneus ventricosus]
MRNRRNLEQMDWKWWNSNELKILNSIRRFQPRCEGSRRTKDLPTLGLRVKGRDETKNPPCGRGGAKGGRNSATLNLASKQTLEHP